MVLLIKNKPSRHRSQPTGLVCAPGNTAREERGEWCALGGAHRCLEDLQLHVTDHQKLFESPLLALEVKGREHIEKEAAWEEVNERRR